MRWPGIEPGSIAWKATILTTIPPTRVQSSKGGAKSFAILEISAMGWIRALADLIEDI